MYMRTASFALLWSLAAARDISYVIEPFERELEYNIGTDASSIRLASSALFGNGSHAILFSDDLTTKAFGLSLDGEVEAHNCWGTEGISLWYKLIFEEDEADEPASVALSMSLTNDLDVTFSANKTELPDPINGGWLEKEWKWDDFGAPGVVVRENLQANIRGWQLSVEAVGSMTVLVDHLSCQGDRLLEALFLDDSTFQFGPSPSKSTWAYRSHESALSVNHTEVTASNSSLYVDYLVEQTAVWGGNFRLDHTAPGNAYYNFSGVDSIRMPYHVTQTASPPERPQLRLILLEGQGCQEGCSAATELENFYSFHYILSNVNEADEDTSIAIPLVGDSDASSPFAFTGWYGQQRNAVLDKEQIKGFSLEISIDPSGKIGSTASGSFSMGPFQAGGPLPPKSNATCTYEPELMMLNAHSFKIIVFEQDCCLRCEMEEDCNYAVSTSGGRDCMVASSIAPDEIAMIRTQDQAQSQRFFIASNSLRWCDVCLCDRSANAIDCRGKDLVTAPSVFDEDWDVQLMDFSENPRLVVIGDSLTPFGNSLEELRLPRNIKHVSKSSTSKLSRLKRITTEGTSGGNAVTRNIVTSKEEAFGNVCCVPQPFVDENAKEGIASRTPGLFSCNMTQDQIGDDTVYEPFVEYVHTIQSEYITSTSSFMAEAAESAEKCAEYCDVSIECRYFTFDTRVNNAGNTCILIHDKYADPATRCCTEANHYADKERTLPGYVSGRPPRARVSDDNARVVVTVTNDVVDKESSYEGSFEVSLGSTPMRGAVWVEPYVSSDTTATVAFIPSRVVLYDSNTSREVVVRASGVEQGSIESLVIGNRVTACDTAFTSLLDDSTLNLAMSLVGDSPRSSSILISSLIVLCILAISTFGIVATIQKEKRKRLEDLVWKIDAEELYFPATPVVLGRGTFGLVLLAEFRGTEVAVKRVLPTRKTTSTGDIEEEGAVNDQLKQSFLAEMRQLSMLRHPCITTVMGKHTKLKSPSNEGLTNFTSCSGAVIDPKSEPLLVMERMDHGSLYDLLHNDTFAMDGELLLNILRDIGQGVRFLHASTPLVLHGDLKAQNILVDGKFRAKVADFGLSQKKSLGVVGTPFWMAPELLRGESCNSSASDVYSFGIILYEVYSRKEPYADDASMGLQRLILSIADPAVSHRPIMPPSSPTTIQAMMLDCVRHDPEQRPSFTEIDMQLQRVSAETVAPRVHDKQNANPTWKIDQKQRTEQLLFHLFPPEVAKT